MIGIGIMQVSLIPRGSTAIVFVCTNRPTDRQTDRRRSIILSPE